MRHFKVIALSVSGLSNRIFHLNEIVAENAWEDGHADELMAQGFLEEYDEEIETIELTEDDMNENPDLELEGLKAGDEIQIAKQKAVGKKNTGK